MNIIPVTKARSILGELAEKVSGEKYFILTKGGNAKAAIVDINYLDRLRKAVAKVFGKTYIDPRLSKYSRIFPNSEIKEGLKEDEL